MAQQQEEGWPLGLLQQPLHVRIGVASNHDFSGSISVNTLLSGSLGAFSGSLSDLDTETESTGSSFFHDKSITLGSLMGVSIRRSSRMMRGRNRQEALKANSGNKSGTYIINKPITWLCSLCPGHSTPTHPDIVINGPSLAHLLAAERTAAAATAFYGPDAIAVPQPNTLFVDGRVAPPRRPI